MFVAAVIAAALTTAAGCGEKSEETTGNAVEDFDLALDFFVNADHAGIYTAMDRGYFADAGLNLRPRVPADPSAPIKQVAAGRVDLAISYEPEVMLAREGGLDVVAVAAIIQEPLTSLISLPAARIKQPADLAGKTVVTAGIPYQTAYLDTILRNNGVDPKEVDQVDVGLNLLQPVLNGRADAMFGGFRNVEGVQLRRTGMNPRVVPVNQLGIPNYDELVLVARGEQVREDPEPIRLFIGALERGTIDARKDPQLATEALLAASPELDRKLTLDEVRATLPFFFPPADRPYGWMDPSEWVAFAGYLADEGQLDQRLGADELLTDELLPGEIPE